MSTVDTPGKPNGKSTFEEMELRTALGLALSASAFSCEMMSL